MSFPLEEREFGIGAAELLQEPEGAALNVSYLVGVIPAATP